MALWSTMAASIPTRANAVYTPSYQRFNTTPPSLTTPTDLKNLTANPYNRQYSNVYRERLAILRDRCLSKALDGGGNTKMISRIIEIAEEQHSTIAGTIIKEMINRPNIDSGDKYHNSMVEIDVKSKEPFRHCCDSKDVIVLEDESGRAELNFDLTDKNYGLELATGVVVAITGIMRNGVIHVEQIYFPEFNSSAEDNLDMEGEGLDVNILLLSGLDCGGPDEGVPGTGSNSFKRDMLIDYLTGHFSSTPDDSESDKSYCSSNICRVLVAGGGCAKPVTPENASPYGDWDSSIKNKKNKASNTATSTNSSIFPIQELDLFLSELCAAGIPVDYIPGIHDPTNANWPQKPIHGCLLPHAERFENMLNRSTNPYEAKIGERLVLGSDGMNIADLRKYLAQRVNVKESAAGDEKEEETALEAVTPLQALLSSLLFNHIAPTAPDSIPTFPFENFDPFVMKNAPDVYFAGNCDKFETNLFDHGEGKQTRLICIPSFVLTGQAVLLNLKTLACSLIEFDDTVVEEISNGKQMEE